MNSTTKAPSFTRTNAGELREAARAGRESPWILRGKLPPLPTNPCMRLLGKAAGRASPPEGGGEAGDAAVGATQNAKRYRAPKAREQPRPRRPNRCGPSPPSAWRRGTAATPALAPAFRPSGPGSAAASPREAPAGSRPPPSAPAPSRSGGR